MLTGSEAPVILWIHGGGFTYGSKTSAGEMSGLLARSQLNGNAGAIIVSINYRLGLFGWLAGGDITPNLGMEHL
jgi:carboxylesterase type B